MRGFIKSLILIVGFIFQLDQTFALVYRDTIYKDNIKTVQLFKSGWEMSQPLIQLKSDDKLELGFDEIGDKVKRYFYTIVHCNVDWSPTDLQFGEYSEGISENPIIDYAFSVSTAVNYIHYKLIFPNENTQPILSGNYALVIYEDNDLSKITFVRRFYVFEMLTKIDVNINRPVGDNSDIGHEVDFKVTCNLPDLRDPMNEIRAVVSQNFRFDNALKLKPLYINDNVLDYHLQDVNVFSAGNEFRNFDIKNVRFQTEFINRIELKPPYYHVFLKPSEDRANKKYFFDEDINGKYYVAMDNSSTKQTDADYFYVHFNLPYDVPVMDGGLYIFGALTDWTCNKRSKMIYNFETKTYELTLLLKQGYYNYEYAFLEVGKKSADQGFMEGNHFETENDYYVFIYYMPVAARYHRLVGYNSANSIKK